MLRLIQPLRERPELGHHRRDLLLVVGRLGHLRDHDQHGLGIDHRLGVVALLESAAGDLHDAGVFVGQIDLVVRARTRLGRLRWLASGLLAGGLFLGLTRGQFGVILGLLPLEALFGLRFDLGLGLGDGGQAIFASRDFVRQADPVGDRPLVCRLRQFHHLLDLGLELGLDLLGVTIGQGAVL